MKAVVSGQAIPYGLARVTPARRDNFVKKFCLSFPILFWHRRGYDINSDLMVDGRWIGRGLITIETFHHTGLRVAVHFGWQVSKKDREQIIRDQQEFYGGLSRSSMTQAGWQRFR